MDSTLLRDCQRLTNKIIDSEFLTTRIQSKRDEFAMQVRENIVLFADIHHSHLLEMCKMSEDEFNRSFVSVLKPKKYTENTFVVENIRKYNVYRNPGVFLHLRLSSPLNEKRSFCFDYFERIPLQYLKDPTELLVPQKMEDTNTKGGRQNYVDGIKRFFKKNYKMKGFDDKLEKQLEEWIDGKREAFETEIEVRGLQFGERKYKILFK